MAVVLQAVEMSVVAVSVAVKGGAMAVATVAVVLAVAPAVELGEAMVALGA